MCRSCLTEAQWGSRLHKVLLQSHADANSSFFPQRPHPVCPLPFRSDPRGHKPQTTHAPSGFQPPSTMVATPMRTKSTLHTPSSCAPHMFFSLLSQGRPATARPREHFTHKAAASSMRLRQIRRSIDDTLSPVPLVFHGFIRGRKQKLGAQESLGWRERTGNSWLCWLGSFGHFLTCSCEQSRGRMQNSRLFVLFQISNLKSQISSLKFQNFAGMSLRDPFRSTYIHT